MTYLLDTDHISILLWKTGVEFKRLSDRLDVHQSSDFAFSIVSFHEQLLGCHTFINRANQPRQVLRGYEMLAHVLGLYATAQIMAFDAPAHREFQRLRRNRIRIGTMDLRIAATALVHKLILLTRNTNDFSKVPGLTFEDWTVP